MAEITASLVKQLRDKTGAGMMDCKKALGETGGDIEAAVDWLRKAGFAAAAKKAGRVAAEGLVAVATVDGKGVAVEVNAETDFVARNDSFKEFVSGVAAAALDVGGNIEAIKTATLPGGGAVQEKMQELVATIGEKMTLRRSAELSVSSGIVASYVHNSVGPGLGRIGVLVGLESGGDTAKLTEFGHQLAMHIAAAAPQWTEQSEVDTTTLDREREILADQARATGKSDDIIAKMVEGRLRKYYEEVVLLDQVFVVDGESKVAKAVETFAAELGAPVKVTGFVRFVLGEGVEKEEQDFAAEVAAVAKG
ncbi:MAG: translation elongation factor Ts [Alphaproteobacteria bacterium]